MLHSDSSQMLYAQIRNNLLRIFWLC